MYSCTKCGKAFEKKGGLTSHEKRKTPCIPAPAPTLANVLVLAPVKAPEPASAQTALSLFSGAGGDTLGLQKAGYNVIAFSENNQDAIATHRFVFPESVLLTHPQTNTTDIKQIPDSVLEAYKGKVNLIFAGFPCQGFSHAGKKKTDDARNELVFEFARAARIIQPEWIIGENVKGLLSRKGKDPFQKDVMKPVIEIIKDLFEKTGYRITYKVIDTSTIGVPQLRKRLIIVGHRGLDAYPHMPWTALEPASTPPQTTIRPCMEPHLEGAMELPPLYNPSAQPDKYWIHTTETVPTGTPHPNMVALIQGIRNKSGKEKEQEKEKNIPPTHTKIVEPKGLISFGVRKGGYHGQVLDLEAPSKTIICTYNLCPRLFVGLKNPTTGTYWIRCLTPKELGQIQGFPVDYGWQGSEKAKIIQIGNAVPPPLAERIARSLPHVTFSDQPQHNGDVSEDEEEE